jgi:hypothetical protein
MGENGPYQEVLTTRGGGGGVRGVGGKCLLVARLKSGSELK